MNWDTGVNLGHWCELGQKFSELSTLQLSLILALTSNGKDDDALNFCPTSRQCPLTSNRKGENSLNFCPNSHQCPNLPHSWYV